MEQVLQIQNMNKENITGILNSAGSKTLAILCHGFLLHKNSIFFPELAGNLAKTGIDSYRFDFVGNGESEGGLKKDSLPKEVRDLHAIIQFFSKKYGKIGLIGHSKGGSITILTAATEKSLSFLITIATVAHPFQHFFTKLTDEERKMFKETGEVSLKKALGKEILLTKGMILGLEKINIPEAASKIQIPYLAVHAEDDKLVTLEEGNDVYIKIKHAEVKLFNEGGHFFNRSPHKEQLIATIIDWIKHV